MLAKDVTDGVWTIQRVRSQVGPEFIDRKSTKTSKPRSVMLPPDVAARIEAAGPGRVFTDVTRQVFRIRWAMACRAAGLDWTPAPRDLRRTFATLARAGGADLEVVQHALGHSKLSTTSIYLDERPEARGEAFLAVQKAMKGAA
jgi:integrase